MADDIYLVVIQELTMLEERKVNEDMKRVKKIPE